MRHIRLVIKALIKLLWSVSHGKAWSGPAPYDYVFDLTANRIHKYLGVDSGEIQKWVIVGGHLGYEIPEILKQYPAAHVDVFECSARYSPVLLKKFENSPRVAVFTKAVSFEVGTAKFFETSLRGAGSLLRLGSAKESYSAQTAESFDVEVVTLDTHYITTGEAPPKIDVLQLDIQGAELMALEGAKNLLKNTRAVFTEVAIRRGLYQDSPSLADISGHLESQGFQLVLLGLDTNLTGNALFLRSV